MPKPTILIESQRYLRKQAHGLETSTRAWLEAMDLLDLPFEVLLAVKKGPNEHLLDVFKQIKPVLLDKAPYPVWEQVLLPMAAKKYKAKLVHATANTASLNLKIPLLLTLHDIIFSKEGLNEVTSLYAALGNQYRKFLLPRLLRKATKIVTVSEEEKSKIVKEFPNWAAKVDVISNCILPMYTQGQEISKPYTIGMFCSGASRKNTQNGIEAIMQMANRLNAPLRVCLINADKHTQNKLNKVCQLTVLPTQSPEQLVEHYQQFVIFLFPSIRESFGLPVWEALACGCQVVSTYHVPAAKSLHPRLFSESDGSVTSLADSLLSAYHNQNNNPFFAPQKAENAAKMYLNIYKSQYI